jgi:ribosomal protein L6P/L9E
MTLYKFRKIQIKKSGKYKFILKGLNQYNLKNTALNITKIKPINVYTLRGLRISRQLVFKRKGKKGSYI